MRSPSLGPKTFGNSSEKLRRVSQNQTPQLQFMLFVAFFFFPFSLFIYLFLTCFNSIAIWNENSDILQLNQQRVKAVEELNKINREKELLVCWWIGLSNWSWKSRLPLQDLKVPQSSLISISISCILNSKNLVWCF